MGLDVYVTYPGVDQKELPSQLHPDHMCNRSYLRSSYNEGGFNSVVGKLLSGKDFYYIFGIKWGAIEDMPGYVPYDEETETGGEWYPSPEHLAECKQRAEEVVAELKAINRPLKSFDVNIGSYFKPGEFDDVTAEEAIQRTYQEFAKYDEQVEKFQKGEAKHEPFGSYSSAQGHFYLDEPVKVIALVPGKSVLNTPCVHVVYEASDIDWYIQAAEITVELIDTMLTHPGASISWSA